MNEQDRLRQQEVMALAKRYEQELLKFAKSRNFPNITIQDIYGLKRPQPQVHQPTGDTSNGALTTLVEVLEEKLASIETTFLKAEVFLGRITTAVEARSQSEPTHEMEEIASTLQRLADVMLGAEALHNKQLDLINRVLDEREHTHTIVENDSEPQVYQERAIRPVALNQSVPQASGKKRHEIIAELLLDYPNINGREVERRTNIPATTANRILKELKST